MTHWHDLDFRQAVDIIADATLAGLDDQLTQIVEALGINSVITHAAKQPMYDMVRIGVVEGIRTLGEQHSDDEFAASSYAMLLTLAAAKLSTSPAEETAR